MDVLIKDCPACGAAVMGDATHCPSCGKPVGSATDIPAAVPRAAIPRPLGESASENSCPKCGATMPKFVIRCRDCGAFMDPAVEAEQRAKQSSLVNQRTWSRAIEADAAQASTLGGSPGTENANAEDNDFDFNADVAVANSVASTGDDDFEFDGEITESTYNEPLAYAESPSGDAYALAEYSQEAPADALPIEDASSAEIPAVTEPAAEAPAEIPETPGAAEAPPQAAHSEATGGDALLAVAMQEEAEAAKRGGARGRRRVTAAPSGNTFVIFCPNGHRVLVQDKHRGRTGRCPQCKAPFFVPGAPKTEEAATEGASETATVGTAATPNTGYDRWLTEVHLHRVNPTKLKLKPDSLLDDYDTADFGAAKDHLLLAVVFSGGGMFRGQMEPKKKPVNRQGMLDHLAEGLGLEKIPVDRHQRIGTEQLSQLKVVQPVPAGDESLFADIPVFGKGRIAVRLPATGEGPERWYVSFTLSQFREFTKLLADLYSISDFGTTAGIPLTDSFTEMTCHYSEAKLKVLGTDKLDYYRADAEMPLDILGWKCAGCGIVVSEDSRKKEKIGGKSPSSVPKAQCPKCKRKFGDQPLHGLKAAATSG